MRPIEDLGTVGLVITGGGLRGAAIPGFIRPLVARGARFGYFGGTSVSALVLGVFAQAQSQREFPVYLEGISEKFLEIGRLGPQVVFPYSLSKIAKRWHKESLLEDTSLVSLLKDFEPERLASSPFIFECATLNKAAKRQDIFSNHDEASQASPKRMELAIRASASLPPIFPPVMIDGQLHSDGQSIVPFMKRDHGCDTIFVIILAPQRTAPKGFLNKHLPWLGHFSDDFLLLLHHLDDIRLENAMMAAQLSGGRPRIVKIPAQLPPMLTVDHFGPGDMRAAQEYAEKQMNEVLDELLA